MAFDSTRTIAAHDKATQTRQHRRDTSAERRLADLSFSEFVRKHNARINKGA